jgi:hypothetical protein
MEHKQIYPILIKHQIIGCFRYVDDILLIYDQRETNVEETFFLIGIVGGGVQLGPLGTAGTNGLLCQPRVIMMMEKLME